jgi:hypothetical protein
LTFPDAALPATAMGLGGAMVDAEILIFAPGWSRASFVYQLLHHEV